MYMKGFTKIKNDSWKVYKDQKKYRHIDMMILRFMKANVGEYFDKWKQMAFKKVQKRYEIAN